MGYTTDFFGEFKITPTLKDEHRKYLEKFNETRRMKRNAELAQALPDEERKATGLPIGKFGEFFVGGTGHAGQDQDASIIEYNHTPPTQPGLWCQWVPNADGTAIVWDEGEKFYYYVEWLEYIIANFMTPWGYVLNGEVEWHGEEYADLGQIVIKDNKLEVKIGKVVFE